MSDKDATRTSFKDGEFGYAPSAMFGGPLDGKHFKLPIMPDSEAPLGFGHAISEPHETSPLAWYSRVTDEPIGGFHLFVFQEMRAPDGQHALADTPRTRLPARGCRDDSHAEPARAERGE